MTYASANSKLLNPLLSSLQYLLVHLFGRQNERGRFYFCQLTAQTLSVVRARQGQNQVSYTLPWSPSMASRSPSTWAIVSSLPRCISEIVHGKQNNRHWRWYCKIQDASFTTKSLKLCTTTPSPSPVLDFMFYNHLPPTLQKPSISLSSPTFWVWKPGNNSRSSCSNAVENMQFLFINNIERCQIMGYKNNFWWRLVCNLQYVTQKIGELNAIAETKFHLFLHVIAIS